MTDIPPTAVEPRLKGSAELWRQAAKLRAEGHTFRQIGAMLGCSGVGVRVALIRPVTLPVPKKAPPIPMCRACGQKKPSRPRGLCWQCFYAPGVKDRHEPVNVYGRRGAGQKGKGGSVTPTIAAPRSTDRVDEMAERAAKGLPLFHRADRLDRR